MSNLKKLITEQETVAGQMTTLKKTLAGIDEQIDGIIGEPIAKARLVQGKDTGIINLQIDGVTVKHDLPKRVKWDNKILTTLVAAIKKAGDDPDRYVDTAYKIPEKRYGTFPDPIKNAFAPARTVEAGKAKVSFTVEV